MINPFLPGFPIRDTRSEWVRLRTLILLRWMAIAGQVAAILVADIFYDIQIDLGLCALAIGASVVANLVAIIVFPVNKRLSESEAMLTLLFDISQLGYLLYLTGGLDNPFALLVLAPVSISATVLHPRTTVFLGAVAIALITVIFAFNVPLRTRGGQEMMVPETLSFGFWVAIVIGIAFLGVYSRRVASEIHSMSEALLATQMALAREQKLTDLGGVVAAAAHELGTPLATIKLVSTELMDELSDRPELREDARLISEQANRCRDILRSMGQAGKDDLHLRLAPITTVTKEAAEPHLHRGKAVIFSSHSALGGDIDQPTIRRQPEIIHGLRNMVQNAVDFAKTSVWIDVEWSERTIVVRISDDGPGYPAAVIGRIGDPFVRPRRATPDPAPRPEYEGMGLGLFIAKTLLERSGALLSFSNGADPFLGEEERPERCGAIVEVTWPRAAIIADRSEALGPNKSITI